MLFRSKTNIDKNLKDIITKLNNENKDIQKQLKKSHKDIDELRFKLIKSEELIESLKAKLNETFEKHDLEIDRIELNYGKQIQAYKDEIEYKDFKLQYMQYKHSQGEELFRKLGSKSKDLQKIYNLIYKDPIPLKKISNVITDNEQLLKELNNMKEKVQLSEIEISRLQFEVQNIEIMHMSGNISEDIR